MHDQIAKYTLKLLCDRTAVPDSIRSCRLDDIVSANRHDERLPLFTGVFLKMTRPEDRCREAFFRLVKERTGA